MERIYELADREEVKGKTFLLQQIQNILEPCGGWFIAGSFANAKVETPGDIDVYFNNVDAYKIAAQYFGVTLKYHNSKRSKLADTYLVPGWGLPVQFVTKHFGTPQEIFDTIDINVCKQAVLPGGKHIADATAFDTVQLGSIESMSRDSLTRYLKYYRRYHPKRNLDKAFCYLVDNYLEDDTLLNCYYADITPEPINRVLYGLFQTHKKYGTEYISRRVQTYITGLIHERAPELLV